MAAYSPTHANSGQRRSNVSTDEFQARQTLLSSKWEEYIKNRVEPVKYDKTVVLLLSWDPSSDSLQTGEEVDRLARVLQDENSYHFEVHRQYLHQDGHQDGHQPPDLQIVMHLTKFIYEHTKAKNTLLIIYYAGHGWADGRSFRMAGNVRTANQQSEQFDRDTFDWVKVEDLLNINRADTLVILDCCHAGYFDRTRSHQRRSCEYLVACDKGSKTKGPGPKSFTNALIWALGELETKDYFNTKQLRQKIKDCPTFPPDQEPLLFHRFEDSLFGEHIILNPKARPLDAAYTNEQLQAQEFINLSFQFNRTTDKTLEQLAIALRGVLGPLKDELAVRRITFLLQDTKAGKWARHWQTQLGSGRRHKNSSASLGNESLELRQTTSPVSDTNMDTPFVGSVTGKESRLNGSPGKLHVEVFEDGLTKPAPTQSYQSDNSDIVMVSASQSLREPEAPTITPSMDAKPATQNGRRLAQGQQPYVLFKNFLAPVKIMLCLALIIALLLNILIYLLRENQPTLWKLWNQVRF